MMRVTNIAFAAALGTAALCVPAIAQQAADPQQTPDAPGAAQSQASPGYGGDTQTAMRSQKHAKKHQGGDTQNSTTQGQSGMQGGGMQGDQGAATQSPQPGR